MKQNYKTSRKYKCPYCDRLAIRSDLVDHVDRKHQELIPEGYTAARAVYDSVNKKNYGTCMICGKKVFTWNDKINRYKNLCDDPKCRQKVRENALERHIRVYNKPTLLNDAEQQEKMLANRRISGKYKFTDGSVVTYTGKYEKNALEFMDKVLNIPAKDIQAPGPVLEYEYNGETHKWITDIYYIPANLLIEIKDGGSNPNNRSMKEYREKQIAKETMVTNIGTFNYIRLTNNNFAQLLDILADIKNGFLEMENPKMKIHINEEVGGLPKNGPPEAYIVPYGMNNAFTGSPGLAYSDTDMDKYVTINGEGEVTPAIDSLIERSPILIYNRSDTEEKKNKIHDLIENNLMNHKKLDRLAFAEVLMDRPLMKWESIILSEYFSYCDKKEESMFTQLITNASSNGPFYINSAIKSFDNVYIFYRDNRYIAFTHARGFDIASTMYNSIDELCKSDEFKFMKTISDNDPFWIDNEEVEE